MKKLALLIMVLGGFSLAACNTVQGVGEDIEAAGRGIGNASEEVEEDINNN